MSEPILEIDHLQVEFRTDEGVVHAVDDVSLTLAAGEVLAIVGESGSGKTVTAMSLLGLNRSPNATFRGSARYRGTQLLTASEDELRAIRGAEMAMIFQDPMTSLNPVQRIGDQIAEQILAHEKLTKAEVRDRVVELMDRVGIPRAAERARAYPHEFSGGMRQRVMIALALSCSPSVLIADEPTTALDVTIQAQILERLKELKDETGTAIILVTHDLGVVADIADRIAVMYGGRIVEEGTVDEIFYDPQHPYTWGLLGSITRVDRDRGERLPSIAGLPPSLLAPPEGCHFRARCPHEFERCGQGPPLEDRGAGHPDRCWLTVEQKRARRVVDDGEIGLAAKVAVEASPEGLVDRRETPPGAPSRVAGDAGAAEDARVAEEDR
ncbi:MAG: ABC transporter ATP-binding protein [Solirubrobacteraceae bacterium]|nr:ABC transporter ATP-binding protein [Solirubrobacteraceae bacterium]